MSILKNRQAAADTSAEKKTPQFEAGEDSGNPSEAAIPERNAKTEVTDVDHKEVVREKQPEDAKVHDVTEVKGKTVNEGAAAGAAAALKRAAEPEAKEEVKEARGEGGAAAEPAAKKEPAASTSTAVAAPQRKVLTNFLSGSKDVPNPLADLKDAFTKNGIELNYDTFPRFRVDAGIIATQDGKEAGTWIELAVVSHGPTWVVGTGDDAEDSKKLVRFSEDGKTVKGAGDDDEWAGVSCETYRDHLREQGYEKAAVKEYTIIYGIALDCEQMDKFAFPNEVVALSLSPTSKGKFDSYVINRAVKARMGVLKETSGNPTVRFTVERVKGKERSYFNLIPTNGKAELPQVVDAE